MKCTNAEWPDLYGHYREAKFTQTKHHWWWKANRIFNELRSTRAYDGKFWLFVIVSVWISLMIFSLLAVPRLRLVFRRGPLRRRGLSPRAKSAQGRERKEERRWRHHLPGNVPETCQGRRWHQLGKSLFSCIPLDLGSICELPEFNSSLFNPNLSWNFELSVIHGCLLLLYTLLSASYCCFMSSYELTIWCC